MGYRIAIDIGGTTAKTTLIEEGRVRITDQYNVGRTTTSPGYPLLVSVVDIVEIGAGDGSIAWVDEWGSFHVGPRSAGASPSPACYGKGSEDPTVTDANLVLGRINPDYFLGGKIKLDVDKAESAIEKLGRTLGTGKIETALGILNLAINNEEMQSSIHSRH